MVWRCVQSRYGVMSPQPTQLKVYGTGGAKTMEGGAELVGAEAKVGEDSYCTLALQTKWTSCCCRRARYDRARVELGQAPGFPRSRTFGHSQLCCSCVYRLWPRSQPAVAVDVVIRPAGCAARTRLVKIVYPQSIEKNSVPPRYKLPQY